MASVADAGMVALTPDRVSEVPVARDALAVPRAVARPEDRPVVAGPAVDELTRRIPAGPYPVVAVAAVDAVEVVAAGDQVVAVAAEQHVVVAPAGHLIVAVAAEHEVVAEAAEELVVAAVAEEAVAAAGALDDVVAGASAAAVAAAG